MPYTIFPAVSLAIVAVAVAVWLVNLIMGG
jgi:hypothetical protein